MLEVVNFDRIVASFGGVVADAVRVALACRIAIEWPVGYVEWCGSTSLRVISCDARSDGLRLLKLASQPFDQGELAVALPDDCPVILLQVEMADAAGRSGCGMSIVEEWRADMVRAVRLFDALRDRRLTLAWQPVVAASTGKVLYREGLLRYVDASGDRVSAGPDIVAVERLRLMRPLDVWVVEHTIDRLRRHPNIVLGCNISASSAVLDRWWDEILVLLDGMPHVASRLVIEITETSDFSGAEQAIAFAARLRAAGCRIALDDFGAGRSSVCEILALDPAIVKIDAQYLVRATEAGGDGDARGLLSRMIALAECGGRAVVVEGVGTRAMRDLATALGAPFLQGWAVGAEGSSQSVGMLTHSAGWADMLPACLRPDVEVQWVPQRSWSAAASLLSLAIVGIGLALWEGVR